MRKSAFSICENKDAVHLRSDCAADQRLCFCYKDSTIPPLLKFEISSMTVQPCLCRTWSKTQKTGFLVMWLMFERETASSVTWKEQKKCIPF